MKLHKNLCIVIIHALEKIFIQGRYADNVVRDTLKKDKRWGSRDRAFIAENIYDIVRWKRRIMFVADIDLNIRNLWTCLGTWFAINDAALPYDWHEFQSISLEKVKRRAQQSNSIRKIRESVPDWLDKIGAEQLGEENWTRELQAQNKKAKAILRVNLLRTNTLQLKTQLEKANIKTHFIPGYNQALVLENHRNIFSSQLFKDGLFEMQDASSQLVAPLMDLKPGMQVIDACAGAGGKTLHMACLMKNKGKIIALDVHADKLEELKKRSKRAQASNIQTRLIRSIKVIEKLRHSADRVLIDAPCSGLGVLKRNPDTKWKLTLRFIEKIKKTQAELLQSYSKMVKPQGKIVYATCSILPSENEKQIQLFLKRNTEFTLEEEKKIFAFETGFDGFYIARLKKQ